MGNRRKKWEEWWERGESGWERRKSRWECWESGCGNAGNGGRNAGNQGGIAGTGNQGDYLRESSCFFLRLKSRRARGAFHHPAFLGSCPTISHTLFAFSTKWISSPSRKWGRGVSPRFHILVFVFSVNQVTPVMETFTSDSVTFKTPSNVSNGALLQKQPSTLTRRLFPQKSSTMDPRPDSKCRSGWRHCECGVWVDCKCMEFVAAGWFTKKRSRFDQYIRNLTSGDADFFG